jgi:hypothetical protein
MMNQYEPWDFGGTSFIFRENPFEKWRKVHVEEAVVKKGRDALRALQVRRRKHFGRNTPVFFVKSLWTKVYL